ncbi:hypothetical protein Q8G46_27800, partial [Klebsiella pneumoniae]|uniref:hypothetical protein n=1 Tax=Klebsiella pneumoniae TaxID=573 RepID=UPI003013D99B
ARRLERAADRLASLAQRQGRALETHAERKRALYLRSAGRLRIETIAERIGRGRDRLAEIDGRTGRAFVRLVERQRDRLDRAWRLAETLSYR